MLPGQQMRRQHQNAASGKTHRFAETHTSIFIAILDREVVHLDDVVAEAVANNDTKRSGPASIEQAR
jgi:hypothetical protein